MQRVHANGIGVFVSRAVRSKARWKRRQERRERGGAGEVRVCRVRDVRRRVAMVVGGRWEVISESISGGRVRRVGAGIFGDGVVVLWRFDVRMLGFEGWSLCLVCCFRGVAFRCQAWQVGSWRGV